jgi:hypothetical protein
MEKATLRSDPSKTVKALIASVGRSVSGSDRVSPLILVRDLSIPVTRSVKVNGLHVDAVALYDKDGVFQIVLRTDVTNTEAVILVSDALGVYCLHGQNKPGEHTGLYGLKLDDQSATPVQKWLRRFTSEMVMPEDAVAARWAAGDTIVKMARRFGVASKIMEDRLRELDLMASKSKFKRIGSSVRNKDARESTWNREY